MRLITVTDEDTGSSVRRMISPEELGTLSGVELAALLWPDPTPDDIATINDFLTRDRNGAA